MLRIEVSEAGQAALQPAIDVDDTSIVIGSIASARVQLPAAAVRPEHVRIEGMRWRAIGRVTVAGTVQEGGDIGEGVTLELGRYRVKVSPSPPGAIAASPQRTESLARELIRQMLGTHAAPALEIVRGPLAGAKRMLAPPESTLVIGRGDEAGWIIADDDLSRVHAEVRRGWEGIHIADLGSKHGTKVDGAVVASSVLHDGALIELGKVVMRFTDPAEQHLRGPSHRPPVVSPPPRIASLAAPVVDERPRASPLPFYAALAILLLAVGALVWLLGS